MPALLAVYYHAAPKRIRQAVDWNATREHAKFQTSTSYEWLWGQEVFHVRTSQSIHTVLNFDQ